MGLSIGCFLAASVGASERTFVVPSAGASTLRFTCVAGHPTRVLLPEPLRRLKGLGPAREALGVTVERASPEAILIVHPRRHPAQGAIDFQGTQLELRLDIATASEDEGDPRDVRVVIESTQPVEAPAGTHENPAVADPPQETLDGSPAPDDASSAVRLGGLDMAALLSAKPVRIDRREGLPGQPELRLLDALEADEWTFFRMRLQDGAQGGISRITSEGAEVEAYAVVPEGADLFVVVQLPREQVSGRTRIELTTGGGIVYRIRTSPPTLPARIREIFN